MTDEEWMVKAYTIIHVVALALPALPEEHRKQLVGFLESAPLSVKTKGTIGTLMAFAEVANGFR